MALNENYGRWESPITAELLAEGSIGIREVVPDGDLIWWSELRPAEKGRTAVVCRKSSGEIIEASPPSANVDTRVHSYGGAAWWAENQTLYYSDLSKSCLFKLKIDFEGKNKDAPVPLTAENHLIHYADGRPALGGEWYICIRETQKETDIESLNEIVAVAADGSQKVAVLAKGADFYSSPRVSPDGKMLAWIQWDHPNMPWDGTELWVAALAGKKSGRKPLKLKKAKKLAGGSREWIFQPQWKSSGQLAYVSDQNGWSTLNLWDSNLWDAAGGIVNGKNVNGKNQGRQYSQKPAINLPALNLEAEIAVPEWVFGESRYCFLPDENGGGKGENLVYASSSTGCDTLTFINLATGRDLIWDCHTSYSQIRPYKNGVLALAGSWETESEILYFKRNSSAQVESKSSSDSGFDYEVIFSPRKEDLDKGFFTPPEAIQFPTGDMSDVGNDMSNIRKGTDSFASLPEGEQIAYGIYYRPANPYVAQLPDATSSFEPGSVKSQTNKPRPPLIVMAHGGPTSCARTSLYLGHRFWTSRGFAVLDVNYRGSTGFGRKYREALNGNWGKTDIEDCVAGARYLIKSGEVNPAQIGIRGGSAGGLTVLMALALFETFSCGAIRYGVADLQALDETTHKFESRYLDRLIGSPDKYKERSPIHHTQKLNSPLLIMSGTEDPIVPLAQSQELAKALKTRGVKHKLLVFEGEGHGFRQSQNLISALNAELEFFLEVFG